VAIVTQVSLLLSYSGTRGKTLQASIRMLILNHQTTFTVPYLYNTTPTTFVIESFLRHLNNITFFNRMGSEFLSLPHLQNLNLC